MLSILLFVLYFFYIVIFLQRVGIGCLDLVVRDHKSFWVVYRFNIIFMVWYGSDGGVDAKMESGIVTKLGK